MISVAEAKTLIAENTKVLSGLRLPLMEASGYILAENIYAITDIPAFEQSSMDGYAFLFEEKDKALHINGEMPAGAPQELVLKKGEAIRIFTGAPLPAGADTVVMQEKVGIDNDALSILDNQLQKGSNVRSKGAEIKAGALAMEKGNLLSPAAVGFLAGIGITEVIVYPAPKVSIIVTGRELQKPGSALQYGQVYESNSYSLRSALKQAQVTDVKVLEADDVLPVLKSVLDNALQNSDVVLLTGGISVGDYDFVLEASKLCGIDKLFHKVKQRPGKPLFFGKKDAKLIFGLPGNPSSVLTCFYEYVLPALEALSSKKRSINIVPAKLDRTFSKVPALTQFLKGHYENGQVSPLNAQESFRLSSFAQANCLICLEEDRTGYAEGETVEVHLLPLS
jgi:molybdopterin molybdotransferase